MKPARENGAMSAWERACLSWSVAIATITGATYWVMRDMMPRTDPFSVLGHPWQPHALGAHVLVAPLLVFGLGLIARDHILGGVMNGDRAGNGRSGLITVLLAAPMVASGYLVQVVTLPGARRWVALTHLVSGLVFAAVFAAHLVAARRRRAAARARAAPTPGEPASSRPAAP
jgi:hypothetical protein